MNTSNNIFLTGSLSGTDYFEGIPFTAQDDDVFIAMFDANGDFNWLLQGTGIDQDQGSGICFNESNGNIYSTGSFNYSMELGGKTVTANGDADFYLGEIAMLAGLNESITPHAFLFYPNPTNGITRNNSENIKSVEVYNETGVKITEITNSGLVDLTNKPAGIYFLKTITSKETVVQKIMKQ